MIAKGAADPLHHRWRVTATTSAREAIAGYVTELGLTRPARVLLPAYYGWSPNEGSGVMDPLVSVGAEVALVRITRELGLDMADYHDALRRFRPDVVMPISYFGWPDPHFDELVHAAHDAGATVLEDGAHALLTRLVNGHAGEAADAIALSLHKTLPVADGGLLIEREERPKTIETTWPGPWSYDLAAIARARRRNARIITELLRAEPDLSLLHAHIDEDVVPLNVPVLVPPDRRQATYVTLNAKGFGVVCLYHKLGPGIMAEAHPDSFWLSARMVNLPCHQDIDPDDLPAFIQAFLAVIRQRS